MPAHNLRRMIFGDKKKLIVPSSAIVGTSFIKGADTSVNLTVPAGLSGDELLIFSMNQGAKTGFTKVNATGSFGMNIALDYKVADNTETTVAMDSSGLSNAGIIAFCVRMRGKNTLDTIVSNVGDWGPSSPHLGPAITTTVADEYMFQAIGLQGTTVGPDAISGWTQLYNDIAVNNATPTPDPTRNFAIGVFYKIRPAAGTEAAVNITWQGGGTSTSFTSIGFGIR